MRNSLVFLLLLILVHGCGGMDTLVDGEVASDGGPVFDGGLSIDAGSGFDTGLVVDAYLPPGTDGGPGTDAYVPPGTDSGIVLDDAYVVLADAWMPAGLCGNGVLDPGEVCDPGVRYPDGGTTSALYVSVCPDCTRVVCGSLPPSFSGGGSPPVDTECVYYLDTLLTATIASLQHAHLLYWTTAAERDAQFAVLRSFVFAGGATSVSGGVALHRLGSNWYFTLPDGTYLDPTVALPPWSSFGGGTCAYLTLTPTDATLTAQPCAPGGSTANFVLVDPPPYAS